MKLSVIIPIYGVEKYLRKCVDSVLRQDLQSSEYEIILVDDGSLDGCPKICDQYAETHPNIRVIHRENGGLSAARNSGIEVARGEYIIFVDSDDYIEPNVLGGLMEQVEREDLDVLRFDHQNVRLITSEGVKELKSGRRYEVFEPNKTPRYIDRKNEVVDGETYLNTRMGYACYAWQFIVRRTILIDDRCIDNRLTSIEDRRLKIEDCLFTEGIHFEDVEWLPRMMLKAKRVNSTTTIVYNYLVRQGSITKTQGDKGKIQKNVEDSLLIIERYKQYREQHPNCTWLYNMQSNMVAGTLTTIARTFHSERKDYIARLKEMNVFPLNIADQGRTYERRARIISLLGPRNFCAIMYLRK